MSKGTNFSAFILKSWFNYFSCVEEENSCLTDTYKQKKKKRDEVLKISKDYPASTCAFWLQGPSKLNDNILVSREYENESCQ